AFYSIIQFIDRIVVWFYPPFKKIIPEQTFKYAATGGMNTALDIFLFFVFYNFLLEKETVELGFIAISPHIAAFLMSFSITFPTGFILAKFISFPGSYLRKRIQLSRYGLTVLGNIVLNYFFLKLFVEEFGWYPTPSKIITTIIGILFSYVSQKHFTFKTTS
ncbi:GtrA family protein, partial [Candidatus Venteria ishoeyi]